MDNYIVGRPYQKRAKEDERDKVAISKVCPTAALVIRRHGERGEGRVGFTLLTRQTGQHDLLPRLARSTPKKKPTQTLPLHSHAINSSSMC